MSLPEKPPRNPRQAHALLFSERQEIERLLKEGWTGCAIARALNRSQSCISREIQFGGGYVDYNAQRSQEEALARLQGANVGRVKARIIRSKHVSARQVVERLETLETVVQTLVELLKEKSRE